MNTIILQGIIKDIQFSHYIQDIEYYKANIVAKREDNKEDIIPIKFKRFNNQYKDGDNVKLIGNIRTFSTKDDSGKYHVQPYVFTYFDIPETAETNKANIDGNICKLGEIHKTKIGIDVLDFIIANNLENNGRIYNTYLPVVAWGKQAKEIAKMKVGDYLKIEGHFSSRAYKKPLGDDFEFKIAYEVNVDNIIKE